MAKILNRGETGFGILIERDSGYVSKELNSELLTEGLAFKEDEPVLINCILQKWGVENKNGRIYPKEVMIPQVEEYLKLVESNSAVSEADHPDCVLASESEILTKNGWKNFKDLDNQDIVQTLNVITNKIEYQKIDQKIYEKYSGEMYYFKSRNFNLKVTPNHRFLLEDNNGVRFYMTADEIYHNIGDVLSSGKNKILKKGDWIGDYRENFILKGSNKNIFHMNLRNDLIEEYTKDLIINSKDWFAFLGIYLSDGHANGSKSRKNIKSYSIVITQKKENNIKKIKDLLDRLPFNYWTTIQSNGNHQFNIHDSRLYNYLFPLGDSHNKYIPNEIKNSSKELLEILFRWFQMGNGRCVDTQNNTKKESVFSTSKKLIDDLQEILIKIGMSGNISIQNNHLKDSWVTDKKSINILADGTEEIIYKKRLIKAENRKPLYNLNISKSNYIWLDKKSFNIEKIIVDDYIGCVTVKNSNFMVRVNGKSYWTGNSSVVSLLNISHLIKKMWWGEGDNANILYGQLEIITSPAYMRSGIVCMVGDKIVEYLKRGIRLGISSRGVGSLKESNGKNIVQDDFELICFDLVASPSTPGAYLFPDRNEIQIGEGNENKDILSTTNNKHNNSLNESNNKIINAINEFLL